MKIAKIKKEMIAYRDFYGGPLLEVDFIEDKTTKEELADIIDTHNSFLECQLCDAQSSLERFKRKVGLDNLD